MPKKTTGAKMTKTKNSVLKTLNQIQPHKLQQLNHIVKLLKTK